MSAKLRTSKNLLTLGQKQHALTEARGTGEGKDGPAPALTDFKKVEENLRKFEDLYRQHLRYGGAYGETGEEVHLVAMVCKRSDVVRGGVKNGRGVPVKEVRRVPDCGL
jgi:hypothetical protein